MEGRTLGEGLGRRVLVPLCVRDTGFEVPGDGRHRRAVTHGWDDDGRPLRRRVGPGGSALPERPRIVTRMRRSVLCPAQRATAEVAGAPLFVFGHGVGRGVVLVEEPDSNFPFLGAGGPGTVGWPGAFGGWWQAEPTADTAMGFLTHNRVEPIQTECGIGRDVYTAIERFRAAALGLGGVSAPPSARPPSYAGT